MYDSFTFKMAGTMDLATILDPSELTGLSLEVKSKFTTFIQNINKKGDELKASYEKLRVNSGKCYEITNFSFQFGSLNVRAGYGSVFLQSSQSI